MTPAPIYTTEQEFDIQGSLYKFGDGHYTVWLKIGVGILEIKAGQIDAVIAQLSNLKEAMEHNKWKETQDV